MGWALPGLGAQPPRKCLVTQPLDTQKMRETSLLRIIVLKNCLNIPYKGYTKDFINESRTSFYVGKA